MPNVIPVDCHTTVSLPGGVTIKLMSIPAGSFSMGSPGDERGRYPNEESHTVTLTQGYYMGSTEVTQAQWEAVTGSPAALDCWGPTYGVGPEYPVYCVSWEQIAGSGGFIDQLNAHLTATAQPGAGLFRLPTDAEWERAARATNDYRFSHGDVLECDDGCGVCGPHFEYLWYCGNDNGQTEPVASKLANGYLLYDMHGGVRELVQDWYTDLLGSDPETDPTGPGSGTTRVGRGGYWGNGVRKCRSASRDPFIPSDPHNQVGFRLARSE